MINVMKTIKDMPQYSRPREKLREKGATALSDEELVAAIIGMGTAGIDVRTIYRGVVPFILLQLLGLVILFNWKSLVTWLPAQAYGG